MPEADLDAAGRSGAIHHWGDLSEIHDYHDLHTSVLAASLATYARWLRRCSTACEPSACRWAPDVPPPAPAHRRRR